MWPYHSVARYINQGYALGLGTHSGSHLGHLGQRLCLEAHGLGFRLGLEAEGLDTV